MPNRGVAASTYGTAGGRSSIRPPIPQFHNPTVAQERVDELRAMWLDGTLVPYCESVLGEVADRMLELLDRDVA